MILVEQTAVMRFADKNKKTVSPCPNETVFFGWPVWLPTAAPAPLRNIAIKAIIGVVAKARAKSVSLFLSKAEVFHSGVQLYKAAESFHADSDLSRIGGK